MITKNYIKNTLKVREAQSHKGENGRLLVVGGSASYFGSPGLVALSALRTGVDIVYVLVPEYISKVVASYSPDLIVREYRGKYLNKNAVKVVEELKKNVDAMVIGNGLTKRQSVLETAKKIVEKWEKPIVIDADCIQSGIKKEGAVYTPHKMEFQRLTNIHLSNDISKIKKIVAKTAKRLNATLLLKGRIDVISDGVRTEVNFTGNSGMTCGGSGDTLAGIVGTFLTQKYTPFEAACLGAYVNGAAGDEAFKKYGYGLCASDIILKIPTVLLSFWKEKMYYPKISSSRKMK